MAIVRAVLVKFISRQLKSYSVFPLFTYSPVTHCLHLFTTGISSCWTFLSVNIVQDESAPTAVAGEQIDEHVAKCLLAMNDPDIITDMRKMNGKPGSSEFNGFWLEFAAIEMRLAQLYKKDVMGR